MRFNPKATLDTSQVEVRQRMEPTTFMNKTSKQSKMDAKKNAMERRLRKMKAV